MGVAIWYKIYGGSNLDYAVAIRRASDGNFIILGQTESNDGDITNYNGGKDIWLFKINASDGSFINTMQEKGFANYTVPVELKTGGIYFLYFIAGLSKEVRQIVIIK